MKNRWIKRIILIVLTCIFFVINEYNVIAEDKKASENEKTTITVALPTKEGINVDEINDSYLTGYTHEYLTKIAQFSAIDFEFIYYNTSNDEIINILNQVANGEIDIMGGMFKNSGYDDVLLYSKLSYGESSSSLLGFVQNTSINERVILNNEDVRIGVNEKTPILMEKLRKYCKDNNISPTIIEYPNYSLMMEGLEKGEVDLITGNDTGRKANLKVVISFDLTPYYFVSSFNKADIMITLNKAMKELKAMDPEFTEYLYDKYYAFPNLSTALTKDEKLLIEKIEPLKVGIVSNKYPLQYYDDSSKTYHGILTDMMELISKNTGLKIKYIKIDDMSNIKNYFEKGEIDLVLGVPMSYNQAIENQYLLTSPIVKLPIVRISKKYPRNSEGIAMSNYLDLDKSYSKVSQDGELFDSVSKGKFKAGFLDGYRAKYFEMQYPDIIITPSTFDSYSLSIGMYNQQDYRIMNILEQGIASISQQQIDEIVYNNVMKTEKQTLINYFVQNPIQGFTIIGIISVISIGVLSLFLYKSNQMKKQVSYERKKYEYLSKYDQLTQVFNQQTFKSYVRESVEKGAFGTIVTMDLDNFKKINDTYGHFEGDRLLMEFGRLLNLIFPEYLVGRLGGDEFMIYLNDVLDEEIIRKKCEEFILKLNMLDKEYDVTVSFGVLIFNKASEFNELYRRVDQILYEVKTNGRNDIKIDYMK